MSELFLTVLNMSLTASYVIIFVILIRLMLKKAPKVISYALWGVVAFRLIIPFSFESMFSLMPRNMNPVPIPHDIIYQQSPQINSGIEVVDSFVSQSLPAPAIGASVNPLQIFVEIGAYIWVLGIIALLIYSLVSILILKRRLKSAQLVEKDVFEAKNLKTPFVLGLFRPKIYIPSGLSADEKSYIILHEQTHIRRFDHMVKMVTFLILCIHWFNPLVWVAFLLMSTDMEMSCDERVVKEMGSKIKQAYSTSLLSLATGRRLINGSPLAFGEGNVKGRIKNILNFKKPAAWVMVVSIILVAALVIGFISNRPSADGSSDWEVYDFPSYLYDRVTFNTEAEIYPPSFEAINAVLVNQEMETGLTCGKAFTLVKQVGNDWRVVPFAEGLTFTQEAINLPVGVSETYRLTPDMLSAKLDMGNYRIVTDVWYANEQPPQTVRTVWADFIISETNMSLSLDDVRTLAKMGDALKFEDFSSFKGADVSSNTNYRIMVYSVEGGYRLIVRTDSNQIDAANLERIWDSGDSGIDIRYNDVDEFIKSHPSSEATLSSVSEKATLSNTPISEKVNIVIMPTDHDPRYSYYYLPEDQQKFSGMMDAMQRTPLDKFPADTYHLNICVAKDGVSWEMLSNGAFFYLDDDGGFLGENKELYDEILQMLREELSFEPFDPNQIRGISAVEVEYTQHNTGQTFSQRITNSNDMKLLEKRFKSAKPVGGVTACPFYEALVTLENNDGSVIRIRLATDSCPIYFANGVCFEYEGSYKEIVGLFDQIPWRE
jgi:beta-lactamase regulating signal transducer with metallopeptidase domain